MTMPLTFFNNDNNTTITLLRGETVELEDGTRVEIKAMDSMGTIWFTLDDEDLLQCVDFKTIKKVACQHHGPCGTIPETIHPFRSFEMNSFDNIQCEETAEAQMVFNMEEMAIYQEWLEQREREAQQELDEIFDELYDAEIDF